MLRVAEENPEWPRFVQLPSFRLRGPHEEVVPTANAIAKSMIFRDAQNAGIGKIATDWNVSGTRDFSSEIGRRRFIGALLGFF
jgi:hypothetical protein